MSSKTNNLFHELLLEEYNKRPKNTDIVAEKRKNFESMLTKASDNLREKKYADAGKNYYDIIDFLESETYLDELKMKPDTEFCIKCCYCYSNIMDPNFLDYALVVEYTEGVIKKLLDEYCTRLFPKYLQVKFSFVTKDYVMALYWCNATETLGEEKEVECINFFKDLIPESVHMIARIELYKEKSLYGYGETLAKNALRKPRIEKYLLWVEEVKNLVANKLMSVKEPLSKLDLHKLYHQEVYPLWYELSAGKSTLYYDEQFISECNECMRAKTQQEIINQQPISKTRQRFEKTLCGSEEHYIRIGNENILRLDISKDTTMEAENSATVEPKPKKSKLSEKKEISVVQTQTDKIKTGNRCIQTDGIKCRNAEVQAGCDLKVLNTMLDIKHKLANQEKKEETITRLNKKICELNDGLKQEGIKRKAMEEKCNKYEFEISRLKEQLALSEKQRNLDVAKNVYLQKFVVDQMNEKFNVHKYIYEILEKKCLFMVNYLKMLHSCLTTISIPSNIACKQNIDMWETRLKKNKEDLENLNDFYRKLRIEMINSDKFNVTWPELPEYPNDDNNIIFISFMPAIKNILDIEHKLKTYPNQVHQPTQVYNMQYLRPQFPLQNSFFIGSRFAFPNMTPSASVPANNTPQECSANLRPELEVQQARNFKPKKIIKMRIFTPNTEMQNKAARMNTSLSRAAKEYEEEKMLFQYIVENCSGATEEEITLALLQVMDKNKGTLSNLAKEKILADVKGILRMKRQSAWVTPKSPHVDWQNDQSDQNCTVCFENFSVKEKYTLPCRHEYHTECIKKWLKTSSVCPICRIHSVIDEEFPPLH